MTRFKLNLKCSLLPHPFSDEPGAGWDIWANFGMEIRDGDGRLVRKVFQAQWDIREFLEWLIENKDHFLKETIPMELLGDETSIAKILHDYLQGIDGDTEDIELSDNLYQYRTKHGIWSGMRGYKVPDVYLGILNGNETVSYYRNKRINWVYKVAIEDFIDQAVKIYEDAMSKR
jgi:hypothetical protein